MAHTNHARLPTVLLAAAILLGGCTAVPPPGTPLTIAGLPPSAHGPVAVDISNTCGAVMLDVDPRAAAPRIHIATRHKPASLNDQPWLAASFEPAEPHPVLRILAADPNGPAKDATDPVYLYVTVPGCAGIRIRNSGGPVLVRGASGAVDIQNGSPVTPGGEVEVIFVDPLDAPVLISTSTGPLRVDIPRASRGLLRLESGTGEVTFEAPRDTVTRVHADAFLHECSLNDGEHEVRLIASQGSVRLRALSQSALRSERPLLPIGWQ
jgi:hypothetical protein